MIGIKVRLKGTGEIDPRYDMTIIDMDQKGKVYCSYVLSEPEGELGLNPGKIPTVSTHYDWFSVSELEVIVYHFTCYDFQAGEKVRLKRPAIREAIEKIRSAEVLEDTAQVVPLSRLDGNYHLIES